MGSPSSIKQTTRPAAEPVTLEEAKGHMAVEVSDFDTDIDRLITAARRHVEGQTRQYIVRQKWRLYFPGFRDEMLFRVARVREVDQIQYIDGDGATQTLATSVYDFDQAGQRVLRAFNQSWPTVRYWHNTVWIDVWVGMYDETASPIDTTADVEEDIKQAILMMVAFWYDQDYAKNGMADPENSVRALLRPYWVPLL